MCVGIIGISDIRYLPRQARGIPFAPFYSVDALGLYQEHEMIVSLDSFRSIGFRYVIVQPGRQELIEKR